MTSDDAMWSEVKAKELRLWVGDPVVGEWCPDCLLPSAWRAPVQRDPAEEPTSWISGCTECRGEEDR